MSHPQTHKHSVPESSKWSAKVLILLAGIFMLTLLPLGPKQSYSKIYRLFFQLNIILEVFYAWGEILHFKVPVSSRISEIEILIFSSLKELLKVLMWFSMTSSLPLEPESIKSKFLWLILEKLRILSFNF